MLIQRLPPSWWSQPDTVDDGYEDVGKVDEDEQDEDMQAILYSRGIASLELAVFNRRNGLGGGWTSGFTSALADLKQATTMDPVRLLTAAFSCRNPSACSFRRYCCADLFVMGFLM